MPQILVADDHALIRAGLRRVLEATDDMVVVGETSNGAEVLSSLNARLPDVLLLDFSMPGSSGFGLIRRVRGDYPFLPVLVLTAHAEEHYAVRVMRAGASGFLSKDVATALLIGAIRTVVAGRRYVSEAFAERLAMASKSGHADAPHDALSNREFEVLDRLVAGASLTDIACTLNVSAKTVSTHKARILETLRLESMASLVRYAVQHRLTP